MVVVIQTQIADRLIKPGVTKAHFAVEVAFCGGLNVEFSKHGNPPFCELAAGGQKTDKKSVIDFFYIPVITFHLYPGALGGPNTHTLGLQLY
jgi:hypothetical protein